MGVLKKRGGQIDFNNFEEKYKSNSKTIISKYNKIKKEVDKIALDKDVVHYLEDLTSKTYKDQGDLIDITNSKKFSIKTAAMYGYAKLYALGYMFTEKGKQNKEIKNAVHGLKEIYRITIFNLIEHFRYDRKELV